MVITHKIHKCLSQLACCLDAVVKLHTVGPLFQQDIQSAFWHPLGDYIERGETDSIHANYHIVVPMNTLLHVSLEVLQ